MSTKSVQNIILFSMALGVIFLAAAIAVSKINDVENHGLIRNRNDALEHKLSENEIKFQSLKEDLFKCEKERQTIKIQLEEYQKYISDVFDIIESKKTAASTNKTNWSTDNIKRLKSIVENIKLNNQKSVNAMNNLRTLISAAQIRNQDILMVAYEINQTLDANNNYLDLLATLIDKNSNHQK